MPAHPTPLGRAPSTGGAALGPAPSPPGNHEEFSMNRPLRLGAVAGALGTGLVLALVVTLVPPAEAASGKASAAAFHDGMRKLWEDHILWTRQYIVSAATLPGDLA